LTVVGVCKPHSELKKPTMCNINAIIFSPLLLFLPRVYGAKEGFESLYDEPYQYQHACFHRLTTTYLDCFSCQKVPK